MLPFLLMRAASAVNERINAQVAQQGHAGLRPVHGLVFARISAAAASVNEIARHLGVTKQSAAAMIDALEADGYVARRPHPGDRRARLVELTDRGEEVTRLAAAAATQETAALADAIGNPQADIVLDALRRLGEGAAPRPSW